MIIDGIEYALNIADNTATIIGYDETYTSLTIKSSILGCTVNCIATNAFYGCPLIISFNLDPMTIFNIQDYAFYQCTINNVNFSVNTLSIGMSSFRECTFIVETFIVSDYTTIIIGDSAFRNSTVKSVDFSITLNIVTIPPNPQTVPPTYPENTTLTIEDNAFSDCSQLTTISCPTWNTLNTGNNVYIENNVYIGNSTFSNCSKLTTINFPLCMTLSIGESAFSACSKLKTITFISWLDVVDTLFLGTVETLVNDVVTLVDVYIDCNVYIGDSTFSDCAITTIDFPSYTTLYIGNETFNNCVITTINFPSCITLNIGDSAFSDCNVETIEFKTTNELCIGQYAFNILNKLIINNCTTLLMGDILFSSAKTVQTIPTLTFYDIDTLHMSSSYVTDTLIIYSTKDVDFKNYFTTTTLKCTIDNLYWARDIPHTSIPIVIV
jgi:hypothetical protein